MEPTVPSGSIVTIDYSAYRGADPARWDIVAFEPPSVAHSPGVPQPVPDQIWILRVVGLPGEEIDFGGDAIVIDGKPLTLPAAVKGIAYLGNAKVGIASRTGDTKVLLAEDEYFMLGDDTENANDSRIWGPLPRSGISGKLAQP